VMPEVVFDRNASRLLPVRMCVSSGRLQLRDFTFMGRSAIQLKYQSYNIKTAAPITLTEV